MTVKELIVLLKRYDSSLRVEIETDIDTYEDMKVDEAFGTVIIKTF